MAEKGSLSAILSKLYIMIRSLVLILFLSITIAVSAQDDEARYSYGAKGGIAVSSFSNNVPHTGSRVGFMIGAFGTYVLNPTLTLQTEINYLQQGGTLLTYRDETRFGAPANFFTVNQTHSNVTLHTIEIPIMVQYQIPISDLPVKVYAGPSASYLLSATDNFERTGETSTGLLVTATGREEVKSLYESFQFGINAGLGFYIPYGGKTIFLDARYRYAVTPSRSYYSYITLNGTDEKIRSNAVSFSVGLIF